MKKQLAIRVLACILALLLGLAGVAGLISLLATTSFADDLTRTNRISAVTVQKNRDRTELKISLILSEATVSGFSGTELHLFALLPWQSLSDLPNLTPELSFYPDKTETTLTVDCTDRQELLYARYVPVQKEGDGSFFIVTDPHYLDNPASLAQGSHEAVTPISKKGLSGSSFSDILPLGASMTVLSVAVNEYLTTEEAEGTRLLHEGSPWRIRSDKLELLDYEIRSLNRAGVRVYLQFVLGAPETSMGTVADCLYGTGVSQTAMYYAFSAGKADGADCLRRFFEEMASRYAGDGMCVRWIIGDRVNEGATCYYHETDSLQAAAEQYVAVLRLADTALRSVNGAGRIYVPLSNRFCAEEDGTATVFGSRDYLGALSEYISATGDFPWQATIDASPSDVMRGDMRQDAQATDSDDTPVLSMANLQRITALLAQESMQYNGTIRPLLIYRFSLPGQSGDQVSEDMQAANYTYAYARAVAETAVEGLIYSSYTDEGSPSGIGGIRAGTADAPDAFKTLAKTVRYIDTDSAEEHCAFALTALGCRNWPELVQGFSVRDFSARKLREVTGTVGDPDPTPDLSIFDFTSDFCGFGLSDNAEYAELRDDGNGRTCMYVGLYGGAYAQNMGISRSFADGWSLKPYQSMTLRVRPEAPAGVENVQLLLTLQTSRSGSVTLEGTAVIRTGEWSQVTFDLTPLRRLTDTVTDMHIQIRPDDDAYAAGSYGLYLSALSARSDPSASVWTVALRVLGALLLAGALFYLFVLFCNIRNRRRRLRRRSR